jgi:hypothetical protein
MKITLFTLLFLFSSAAIWAQPGRNRCQNGPLNRQTFLQQKRAVGALQQAGDKLEQAKSVALGFCLSSDQVREIAELFDNDFDRLEFTKEAWHTVFDKEQYLTVMDAFIQASAMFQLYQHIQAEQQAPMPGTVPSPIPTVAYPDAQAYTGNTGCQSPASDVNFDIAFLQIAEQADDQARMNNARMHWQNNCFSVTQIMKFALEFKQEGARFQFLKNVSSKVYDTGNLNFAVQVLPSDNLKKEWYQWLSGQQSTTPAAAGETTCSVTEDSMGKILNSLRQQGVNSSRTNLAKQQIRVHKCFTAQQVKRIVATLSVESSRLEVMKFAFEYTVDPAEYLNILDVLTVQSSRDEVAKMVR